MGVLHRICQDRHRPACELNPDVPIELSKVIDRLLEKKPSRRFANAAELKLALRKLLATWQQGGLSRSNRITGRWPWAVAVVISMVLLVIASLYFAKSPLQDSGNAQQISTERSPEAPEANQPKPALSSTLEQQEWMSIQTEFQELESNLKRLETEHANSHFFVPKNEWHSKPNSSNDGLSSRIRRAREKLN